jgi:hypothetical protein
MGARKRPTRRESAAASMRSDAVLSGVVVAVVVVVFTDRTAGWRGLIDRSVLRFTSTPRTISI